MISNATNQEQVNQGERLPAEEHQEAAEALGISRRVADGLWAYARAWLLAEMRHEPGQTKLPETSETGV